MAFTSLSPAPVNDLAEDSDDRRIIAYRVSECTAEIVAASPRRDWMDQTAERFAYRCLPLVIANQLGWDLLNPVSFRARWLGGDSPNDLQVQSADAKTPLLAFSLFGHGVLTFSAGSLFRTPRGISLLVTGPFNHPKDGIYPLSGIVETDWSNATFTMNYRFTRPGHWIEFAAGEPFCRLVPLSLDLPEELTPELAAIDENPELAKSYCEWATARDSFNRKLDNPWSSESKIGWQKEYFQGRSNTGIQIDRHRTQLHQREFGSRMKTYNKSKSTAPRTRVERRDAEHYLWHETELFYNRRQKSAQVLVGLAQTLRRAGLLNGGEEVFLDTFDQLLAIDAAVFSDVWQEPRAYFWTRMAFQLADANLNGAPLTPLAHDYYRELGATTLLDALQIHLDRFSEFGIAAAVLAGVDWQSQTPVQVELPWAIPATDWCIAGEGPCEVVAFQNNVLYLRQQSRDFALPLTDESDNLIRSPIVEYAGCRLRLQPQALAGLGLKSVDAVLNEGEGYSRRHTELLRNALAAIERFAPNVFEQISGTIRIMGLKSSDGDFTNISFSELPGAMLLSVVDHPLVMADRIIHEFHHNRLFHIEDCGSLFDSQSPSEEEFYSPWRNDRRPLKGVLHGLYVFIAVGRFWRQVYLQGGLSDEDRSLVTDQLLRIGRQVTLARDELVRNSHFTPPGQGLFAQLSADVDDLNDQIAALGLCHDAPAVEVRDDGSIVPQLNRETNDPLTVLQAIEEHRLAFSQAAHR